MIPYADLEEALKRWKARKAAAADAGYAAGPASEVALGAAGEDGTGGGMPSAVIDGETSSSSIQIGDADLDADGQK